ncbi:NSFL1 cofactor p47 [Neodiprion fabricii]|uniref:NSFL1 cofactor p47 n=1 Tax=Neodiprion fabricii TaxID=2872261 RepID=UPI001ED97B2A|nr:NSFL1 cofactor p47 [Neodiprion fabricii]XP_046428051.1 NSFL1 cofactor p47 [Neodiprion fabricii]
MADREELVSQFRDVTGTDAERAQFYLDSSAWQLEVALASFYENDEPADLVNEPVEDVASDDDVGELPRLIDSTPAEMKSSQPLPKPKARFGTIADLQKRDSSSEEEEGQAFYAGGSEHSGQQVLGPGKKRDIVGDMFKSCQEQAVSSDPRATSQQRPSTFGGTGYKLGQTSSDTEVTPSPSTQESNTGLITLKLWREGFTLNDGDIRPYNDPGNREFLAAIKRGEVPMEIRQEVQGAEVRLDMEDHRHEEFVPPKVKVKAFTGKGHMLGSPSPATVGITVPVGSVDQTANESQATRELNVDSSQPVTTIQIRLADGSSIRAQFNLTHTVSDIRRYISTMRPQYAASNFRLLTSYPSKELTEESKTIEEAGLKNSAIMQRL